MTKPITKALPHSGTAEIRFSGWRTGPGKEALDWVHRQNEVTIG